MANYIFNANALGMQPTASGGATRELRNGHPVIEFANAATQSVDIDGLKLTSYSGLGLTFDIEWMADTATSGNCVWQIEVERHQRDTTDLDADSFAAGNTFTDAVASAAGETVQAQITFTDGADMDSIADGEGFRVRLSRLGGNGSDTMTGAAQVISCSCFETGT